MKREEIVKELHKVLNAVDITFPYRLELINAIEYLSEPSLPSDLDEAAKEYCKDEMNYDDSLFFHRQYLATIFKAGAEWQKVKMMEKAVDGKVIKSYNPVTAIGQPTLHGIELIYPDKGKPYLVAGDKVKIIVIPEEK